MSRSALEIVRRPSPAWGVFALALALRLLFVASTTITPVSDAKRYIEQADRLFAGLGFVSALGLPTAYPPPGYPILLAGIRAVLGTDPRATAFVQALMGAFTCLLAFHVCDRSFGRRAAVVAGLFLAISPTSIPYAGEILAETTTTLALVSVLFLLIPAAPEEDALRPGRLVRIWGVGLLLGAAILLRPAVLAWGVGVGWCLLISPSPSLRRRVLPATALAIGVLAVLAPWTYRNYRVAGSVVPVSTNGGYNLYLGNNARAHGGGWMSLPDVTAPADTEDEFGRDREDRRRAVEWIRDNPAAYARLTVRRALVWFSVAPDRVPGIRLTSTAEVDEAIVRADRERRTSRRTPPDVPALHRSKRLNAGILVFWSLVTIPLALLGILLDLQRRPRCLLILPLVAYATVLSLTFMQSRFREVMTPILLIYSAAGLCGLREGIIDRAGASGRWKSMLWIGLLPAAVFCLQLVRDRDLIGVLLGR